MYAEEMERELIDTGPHTPCIIESMKNYAKGAFIGVQMAGFLAQMGYSARANHVEPIPGFQGFLNKQPLFAKRYPHVFGAPDEMRPLTIPNDHGNMTMSLT